MSSFRTSNQLSDLLMALLSGEEWKVLYYVIRRTHGLRMPDGNRISLREFAYGHSENGEQKDYGTGLSIPTVEKCIRELRRFGVLIEVEPANMPEAIAATYKVETDHTLIDIEALELRAANRANANRARTEKARQSRAETYIVGQNSTPIVPQNSPTTPIVALDSPIQSDREDLCSATEETYIVGQNANKERQKYIVSSNGDSSRARSKPRSLKRSRGDPRSQHVAIQSYHAAVGRYPPKILYDKVITTLGDAPDLDFLIECATEAAKRGFGHKPGIWLFEWYAGGEIPPDGGKHGFESASERNVRRLRESADLFGVETGDTSQDNSEGKGRLQLVSSGKG